MDIKKWYPSTIARPSAKVIRGMIIDSGIDFEGIDYNAVARHLGEHMSKDEIIEDQFEEIVYIKKEKKQKRKADQNTKACGDSTVDVTLVRDDGQTRAHETLHRLNKKEKTDLNTKACGDSTGDVTLFREDG